MHALLSPLPAIGHGALLAADTFGAAIQSYAHGLKAARERADIAELLADATRTLEFDHYALVPSVDPQSTEAPAILSNLPAAWTRTLTADGQWLHDPVMAACRARIAPFEWADLARIVTLTPNHHGFLRLAAAQGMERGWTVPFHIPGEASGACSFIVTGRRELPRHSLPAAQYLASFALEAARRLQHQEILRPKLTRRQIECTILAGRGKSDWVAAQILGLAPDTVHKYLEQAKARYGVSSRTELVVRALHNGQISFSDLFD